MRCSTADSAPFVRSGSRSIPGVALAESVEPQMRFAPWTLQWWSPSPRHCLGGVRPVRPELKGDFHAVEAAVEQLQDALVQLDRGGPGATHGLVQPWRKLDVPTANHGLACAPLFDGP